MGVLGVLVIVGGVVVVPLIIGMAMKLGGTPAPGADRDDNRS